MPVHTPIPIPRLSQEQFKHVAYGVMKHVFDIHADFGGCFDEIIYKRELALRIPGLRLEVPIEVIHRSFSKRYFVDAVTSDGGVFEFKTNTQIVQKNRAQLMHYLALLDVGHGKIINLRTREVLHDFVNAPITRTERLRFSINQDQFLHNAPGATCLEQIVLPLLEDLGTCLELALYEAAVIHLLGGEQNVMRKFEVFGSDLSPLGFHQISMCAENSAFKVTTLPNTQDGYGNHCRNMLRRLRLDTLHWVNIATHEVTFITLKRS